MEYGLTRRVLESDQFIPLSESEFILARDARDGILAALRVEEKFNLVLENYVELEQEALRMSLEDAVFWQGGWSQSVETIYLLNRRLVNLLSTARLYRDHIQHDLGSRSQLLQDVGQAAMEEAKVEHDARLGYRVMEKLRNYMQHRGLPLSRIQFNGRWEESPLGKKRVHRTTLYIDLSALAEDPKFSRPILKELAAIDEERVPVKPLYRDYVTGLFRIQGRLRKMMQGRIDEWEAALQSFMQRYQMETGEASLLGLCAAERDPDGLLLDQVLIFPDYIEKRRALALKNRGAGELMAVVVSSE